MTGRRVEQLYPARPVGHRPGAARGADLRRLPEVRGVSLQVRAGEVVGLGGLVGSGRTELLHLIYGLEVPEEGEVAWTGGCCPPAVRAPRSGAGLGLAPEDRKSQGLVLGWSLAKNVSLADLRRFERGPLIDVGREREEVRAQLRALSTVPDDPGREARLLSGGNQQKVVLARWLLRECRVLLLDEPTRGVDIPTKAELYKLIAGLAGAAWACWWSRRSSRSWSGSARGSS